MTSLATAFPTGDLEQQIFVEVTVYFTDSKRYASSVPPFEVGVMCQVPSWTPLPEAVLVEFFSERTEEEQALGLERVTRGFTG